VAAAQERDQGLLDDLALAKDDGTDAPTDQVESAAQGFDSGDQIVRGGVDRCGRRQALRPLFEFCGGRACDREPHPGQILNLPVAQYAAAVISAGSPMLRTNLDEIVTAGLQPVATAAPGARVPYILGRDGREEDVRDRKRVTREGVVARFAQGREPGRRGYGGTADPAEAAVLRRALRGDHDLNPGMTPPSIELRPAAVLVPLLDRAEGMTVLLTRRSAHLSAHAGQIAFPGGRIEAGDPDASATALREAEEEIGLPRDHVTLIGRLDTYVTGTGFEITPLVGVVRVPFPLTIDPFEVAEAFEVPLDFILDPANHHRTERVFGHRVRVFFDLPFEHRNIWGATAGMLVNLAEVLAA
jgi:8-oxo-dGTP pyrophosphatase MutT (NUDIX family)